MKKRILFLCIVTALIPLLFAKQTSRDFLSSLHFTRDALSDFSRGSQRTVDISLMPRNSTKMVNKTYFILNNSCESIQDCVAGSVKLVELIKGNGEKESESNKMDSDEYFTLQPEDIDNFLDHSTRKNLPRKVIVKVQSGRKNGRRRLVFISFNGTTTINQTKREVYRPRSSPSNKFMKALKDVELALVNANAYVVRYKHGTLAKLKALVKRAIQRNSYKFARQIVGRIMYLLSTKPKTQGRTKRSSTNEGSKFLRSLRKSVGRGTFDSFMAVQGDVSLMFVIDDTGSMRDEIQAAKNIVNDIINYKRKVPIKEYILSPFNDPYPYPSREDPVVVKSETEAGDFEKEIKNLKAFGGGDCPEYTFEGIRGALAKLSFDGSPMYVFTDAGPKDATEVAIEEVKIMAEDRDVAINFLASGHCNYAGDNVLARGPRDLHPAFLKLAKSTSGLAIVFQTRKQLEKVSNWTIGMMEGDSIVFIGSTTTDRSRRSPGESTNRQYKIPVDDSIEKMSVIINTVREGNGITLKDSDNVSITSGILSLSHLTMYEIMNPKRGAWSLTVPGSNGGHEFFVMSSMTEIHFEHFFLIALPRSRRHTVEVPISNPVPGKVNKIVISLAGSEKVNNSSLRLQLITAEGNHISDVTLKQQSRSHYIASFNPKALARSFKLKLKGTTRSGYPFERISRQTVKPATAVLRSKYASNDYTLPLGRTTFIHFQLCNFGTTETFDVVVIKDILSYVLPRRVSPKSVIKGRCVIISVYAKAIGFQDVGKTDAVFVILKGRRSRVFVSQTVHLLVDN